MTMNLAAAHLSCTFWKRDWSARCCYGPGYVVTLTGHGHFFSSQHRSVSCRCGGFTCVSVSASACNDARLASSTRVVVVFPSSISSQPCLSRIVRTLAVVPFCFISHTTDRLRTSGRSLSPLLMPLHRHEMGLRPPLDRHVSCVTDS